MTGTPDELLSFTVTDHDGDCRCRAILHLRAEGYSRLPCWVSRWVESKQELLVEGARRMGCSTSILSVCEPPTRVTLVLTSELSSRTAVNLVTVWMARSLNRTRLIFFLASLDSRRSHARQSSASSPPCGFLTTDLCEPSGRQILKRSWVICDTWSSWNSGLRGFGMRRTFFF